LPRIVSAVLVVSLLAVLAACDRAPVSYPPPEQRPAVEGPTPEPAMMMVELRDTDATVHYVKDIEPGEGWWRWTTQQPTVKVLTYTTGNLKMVVDFALWDTAMLQTGPVELSFFVNDHLLDKVRYTKPGQEHFEKPVPPAWLRTDEESTAAVAIDKLYTAPQDGKKFGFILVRIGFAPK
jgi:hypothetical protein